MMMRSTIDVTSVLLVLAVVRFAFFCEAGVVYRYHLCHLANGPSIE
jgi:hypothetical protein